MAISSSAVHEVRNGTPAAWLAVRHGDGITG